MTDVQTPKMNSSGERLFDTYLRCLRVVRAANEDLDELLAPLAEEDRRAMEGYRLDLRSWIQILAAPLMKDYMRDAAALPAAAASNFWLRTPILASLERLVSRSVDNLRALEHLDKIEADARGIGNLLESALDNSSTSFFSSSNGEANDFVMERIESAQEKLLQKRSVNAMRERAALDTTSGSNSSDAPTPRPSHPTPQPARPSLAPKTIPIGENITVPNSTSPKTIFIVHGHDTSTVNDVRIEVNDLTGIMPEILADSAGRGDTIIEKFERRAAESDYAIVVLTPDDEGRAKCNGSAELQARARQNVILELGYFYARLGRTKVAVIHHGVELPSDINGVNYITYDTTTWRKELRGELNAAGFELKK
ncbi:TIR domain-containing protein [Arthrobacter sp. NPDC056886]|uniref:TIR domain-containing protein n=1 Tax=Arthrobacter sp. NPDC056886 TaxID=3345960 RepID=UPI00366BE998